MENMKFNFNEINNEYRIHKRMIHESKEPVTTKLEDQKNYTRIEPLIPISVAKNLILSNDLLFTCIETLAQDIILNEIKILNEELNEVDNNITDFWNTKNTYELYLAVQDRIGYGYAALEILFNDKGEPIGLKQISAETITISVETDRYTMEKSYYCLYNNGTSHERMKLSRFNYTPEDNELSTVLWLGGGRVSDFYDIPCWVPAFNKISADALLDELNAKKINEGNLISGILTVVSPPMNKSEIDEETGDLITVSAKEQIDNSLQEQMVEAGTGILTLHLQQLTAELPLEVDYIKITEDNYDYLLKLAEDCDESILRLFKIPKIRLMVNTDKESMNSNKSDTIYQIYTKELASQQLKYTPVIDNFNSKYFDTVTVTTIQLPVFSDKKEIEVQNILNLFNTGIITLNDAIKQINTLYPEYNIELDNIIGNNRFYNGQVLGMNEYDPELSENKILSDFYAFFE